MFLVDKIIEAWQTDKSTFCLVVVMLVALFTMPFSFNTYPKE